MTSIHDGMKVGLNGAENTSLPVKKELTPDDFITLFLKQLTNQNPLRPADSSTILQQMADISTISASKDTQKALTNLQRNIALTLGNSQILNATQLIGKRVEVGSGLSQLVKDEGLSGSVVLPAAASNIKVMVKDKDGKVIKEITLDPTTSGGLVDFNWDGMNDETKTAYNPDFYSIAATATIDGKETEIETLGAFKVKSVASNHANGDVILNVDGLGGLGLNEVRKIL